MRSLNSIRKLVMAAALMFVPAASFAGVFISVNIAPPALPVYHWGDIDEGGFRIAAVLAATAQAAGRRLQPWMMSPSDLPGALLAQAGAPAAASLAAMLRGAERSGWSAVADQLRQRPIRLEQESLEPLLPGA